MSLINVRSAARLTGKDRSTIIRAVESGRLSASRDDRGRYLIDPSELERAFGSLRSPDAPDDADSDVLPQSASVDTSRVAALEREVELLREMLERERRTWDDERIFLRSLVGEQSGQIKLLTDQREERERIATQVRPSMLTRFFGRR